MGDTSIYFSDYSDWIRPREEAIGAFYTDRSNWWHIVDTVSDPNRKANSPTHSMWIGDESKGDGEYKVDGITLSTLLSNSLSEMALNYLSSTIMILKVKVTPTTVVMYKLVQMMVYRGK